MYLASKIEGSCIEIRTSVGRALNMLIANVFSYHQHLTYRIVNYTPDLTKKEVDDTIKKALDQWSSASQIKFERITDPNKEADIMIKFVSGYHGDSRPADGPGKELAHAFFPLDNTGIVTNQC